jgi:hypothetical protein
MPVKLIAITALTLAIAGVAAAGGNRSYHYNTHTHSAWHFPSGMSKLTRYRTIARHDKWVIKTAKAHPTWFPRPLVKLHGRERTHANAHIKKIEARLHPAVDINAWPWGPLVQCEAHGNWQYNGDDGDIFEGGPNFHPQTWDDYKGRVPGASQYEAAYDAPPTVQIAVAEVVLAENGWGAWPECSYTIGAR